VSRDRMGVTFTGVVPKFFTTHLVSWKLQLKDLQLTKDPSTFRYGIIIVEERTASALMLLLHHSVSYHIRSYVFPMP
jgi:hypothetical protein